MKYLALIFLIAVSAFAGHRVTITCSFEATAEGYSDFTVSEDKIYANDELYNDDGGREEYWGEYQYNAANHLPINDKKKCKFKISVFPSLYPMVAIYDGKQNRYIVFSTQNFLRYEKFKNLKVDQKSDKGNFHCNVKEGWAN